MSDMDKISFWLSVAGTIVCGALILGLLYVLWKLWKEGGQW